MDGEGGERKEHDKREAEVRRDKERLISNSSLTELWQEARSWTQERYSRAGERRTQKGRDAKIEGEGGETSKWKKRA